MSKCDVRLRDGSWTAGSIIENFRVKKNCNFIEGERRAWRTLGIVESARGAFLKYSYPYATRE